jgi:hypothetical protein
MAPEYIIQCVVSIKADIYSLDVIIIRIQSSIKSGIYSLGIIIIKYSQGSRHIYSLGVIIIKIQSRIFGGKQIPNHYSKAS